MSSHCGPLSSRAGTSHSFLLQPGLHYTLFTQGGAPPFVKKICRNICHMSDVMSHIGAVGCCLHLPSRVGASFYRYPGVYGGTIA
jgi:hypothetical protein